jgi:hypothetical protein
LQNGGDFLVSDLFFNRKPHGPSPWFMDQRRRDPRWTQNRGGDGGSPELLLPADTGHGGSSRGGENKDELVRVQFRPSPKLVRWQGGDATAVELRLRMVTAWAR